MKIIAQTIRRYPLTLLCIAAIWYLSFFTPPHTELEEVPFMDKWVHIAMYGGTWTVVWIEYLRSHTRLNGRKLFLWAWLLPIVMSGTIELLQAYCTGGRRSGDWFDLLANSVGVTLAFALGLLFRRVFFCRR